MSDTKKRLRCDLETKQSDELGHQEKEESKDKENEWYDKLYQGYMKVCKSSSQEVKEALSQVLAKGMVQDVKRVVAGEEAGKASFSSLKPGHLGGELGMRIFRELDCGGLGDYTFLPEDIVADAIESYENVFVPILRSIHLAFKVFLVEKTDALKELFER